MLARLGQFGGREEGGAVWALCQVLQRDPRSCSARHNCAPKPCPRGWPGLCLSCLPGNTWNLTTVKEELLLSGEQGVSLQLLPGTGSLWSVIIYDLGRWKTAS